MNSAGKLAHYLREICQNPHIWPNLGIVIPYIHENTQNKVKNVDKFEFIFDFAVSNIKIMTKDDLIRNKKTQLSAEEYEFIENFDDSKEEQNDENQENEENEFLDRYL